MSYSRYMVLLNPNGYERCATLATDFYKDNYDPKYKHVNLLFNILNGNVQEKGCFNDILV